MQEQVPPILSAMSKMIKELKEMEQRVMTEMDRRHKNFVTTSVMQQKASTVLLEKLSDLETRVAKMEDMDARLRYVEHLGTRLSYVEGFIDQLVGGSDQESLKTFLKSGDYLCEIGRLDECVHDINVRIDSALRRCKRNTKNVENLHAFVKKKYS